MGLVFSGVVTLRAQAEEAGPDGVVTMEAFNVSAYGGRIKLVDGLTGKEYRGDHPVVFALAESFNPLLIGFHKRLVLDEVKHMRFRLELAAVSRRR